MIAGSALRPASILRRVSGEAAPWQRRLRQIIESRPRGRHADPCGRPAEVLFVRPWRRRPLALRPAIRITFGPRWPGLGRTAEESAGRVALGAGGGGRGG